MNTTPIRTTLSVAGGAIAVICVVSGWYAVTPRMTVDAMATAASRGDSVALASHMDMPALRRDIRSRAQEALERADTPNLVILDPKAVTEALVGPAIDRAFSLDGTRRVLDRSRNHVSMPDVRYRIMRNGPNGFVARVESPHHVDLLFTRRGLSWMLTGIAARPQPGPRTLI